MNSILKRIRDQVNPFDGGKTFNSPQQRQAPMNSGKQRQLFEQAPSMTPSQRDFPGRTNYGVPEDNMIDTPNGYITAQQYDQQQIRGSSPLMFEDQSYQGNPYLLQPTNPGYTFYEDNTFSTPQQNPYSRLRKLLGR